MPPKTPLHAAALAHWDAGRLKEALADGWALFDAAPGTVASKALLVDILAAAPQHATAARSEDLLRLVRDPDVNPAVVARAGWQAVLRNGPFAHDMKAVAGETERNPLIRALLEETPVTVMEVERIFTQARRALLLEGTWQRFPLTVQALAAQTRRNGGAWLFEADERARLAAEPDAPIADAYAVSPPASRAAAASGDCVAEQYEAWPYPQWTRVTRRPPQQLADAVRELDPNGPDAIPQAPEILIAGCGTGREIAFHRVRYPDARITAIDVSGESLRYADERLAQAGLGGAELIRHDLHDVAALRRRFDFISCIGVLHHLPDPEKGWAALTRVLKPGGVMQIMVYSAAARLRVLAVRTGFADLLGQPMSDDFLREARRRAIARDAKGIVGSNDFFTLAGVHDLLLHRHEDPFDVRRIGRALDTLGLELLTFKLTNRNRRARYRAMHPGDPLLRDRAAWEALEMAEPMLFSGMHEFWCRKPTATR
jgi:SAM-dependent methyltransferase